MLIMPSKPVFYASLMFMLIVQAANASADKPGKTASKLQKFGAMSCFIRYQWFELSIISKINNIPASALTKEINSRFKNPHSDDWKKSAETAMKLVYAYPPQTAKVYADMGNTMMDKCLKQKNISMYKNKISSCVQFANAARLIYVERNKGTRLRDAEIKLRPILSGNHISLKLVKDIYKSKQDLTSYRLQIWEGCAFNIDGKQGLGRKHKK